MTTTKKIMIVDDDEDDMEFFCEAVKEIDASCTCVTATNGEEALQKLRKGKTKLPDLIFLDLNMPRMDGKTCLRELKKDRELKNIPVIISTTSSHHKDRQETLQLGAVHFMTKSSTFNQIKTGIEKAMHMIRSASEKAK